MNNKNEVFEYLIDQLRQQLQVVDVMGEIKRWSIDRSITGRGNYTDEENAVIDAYIGLEHNPYKQRCEDLAHEVLSLKNQLRDASAQIKELHLALAQATGDVEAYKLIRKGEHVPGAKSDVYMYFGATEQCGCNGDDAQPSIPTGWVRWRGGACPVPDTIAVDVMFRDSQIIEHITPSSVLWEHHGALHGREIIAYRAPSNCEHTFVPDEYGLGSICLRCGAKE